MHEAAQGKHTCDWCGATVTACNDADTDHACDVCGAQIGTHEAAQGKHTCDWCGVTVTACNDADTDHDCDVCGKAVSEHAWSDATCTDPKTCTVCGATEGSVNAHTPGEWVIDTPAAPGVAGQKHQSCTACGAVVNTESIEALPIETLPTDTAPSTDTPTEPVTEPTATTPTEEQSGCAASVKGGSAIVLITLLGIGVVLLRKKRTNQK